MQFIVYHLNKASTSQKYTSMKLLIKEKEIKLWCRQIGFHLWNDKVILWTKLALYLNGNTSLLQVVNASFIILRL